MKRRFILKHGKAFIYKTSKKLHLNINVPKANTENGHLYSVTRLCPQLAGLSTVLGCGQRAAPTWRMKRVVHSCEAHCG